MLGSARATTVESSIRMKSPAQAPARVHQGRSARRRGTRSAAAPARSRSGSMPQRSPTSTSSGSSGQRSGRSSPSCSGLAPFSAMRAGVVADRADLGDVGLGEALLGQRRELGALLLDRPRRRPGLLDQGRGDAVDRRVGEVPLAGELHRRQPGALGDRAHPLELLEAGLDPALGAERAVVALRPAPSRPRRRPRTGRRSRRPG